VDWSRYNGKTTMRDAVDAFGLCGVMARCSIGASYKDPYYDWNHEQARILGILFGAYHVLRPWDRQPLKEADEFAKKMLTDGDKPDFAVGDYELPNTPADWKLITAKEVGQQIVLQLPGIRDRTGLVVLTYSGSWWWGSPSHLSCAPLGIETMFPLIEAEYVAKSTPKGKVTWAQAPEAPRLPTPGAGWRKEDIVGWQWTDSLVGTGCGPDGNKYQDGDVLIPTYEEFLVMIGKKAQVTDKAKLEILWVHHPELHPEAP
jgi:hypothetical protein